MCSAWFLCDSSSARPDKCIQLTLDSLTISIIGLVIASLFIHPSLKEIVQCIFPITFQMNWFVGCYIIYFLIHPLLNNAVKEITKSQFRALVLMMFMAYSIISTLHQSYYFTNLVALIMMHYMVSYAKRYELYSHKDKHDVFAAITFSSILLLSIVLIIALGTNVNVIANKNLLLCHFYNPLIIGIVMPALFISARKKWTLVVINTISGLSLFVYLIHGNYFWQAYGKYFVHSQMAGLGKLGSSILLFFLTVITSVLIAFFYKTTLGKVTIRLSIRIGSGVTKLLKLDAF